MAYTLPDLPYDYSALEPHIDAQTMEIHHTKHHQKYIDTANEALSGTEWADKPAEEVLQNLSSLPNDIKTKVRNNAGGHANHSLFWTVMGPDGGGEPSGAVADAISDTFGSFKQFQEKFTETGVGQFGSGWAWLVLDGGSLDVIGLPNQDSPVIEGKVPILGVDVWEHAYYLKYQNKRPDYIEAWWNTVNWDEVNRRFEAAK
jgi:superoxide dismutase, Fe-Mn family